MLRQKGGWQECEAIKVPGEVIQSHLQLTLPPGICRLAHSGIQRRLPFFWSFLSFSPLSSLKWFQTFFHVKLIWRVIQLPGASKEFLKFPFHHAALLYKHTQAGAGISSQTLGLNSSPKEHFVGSLETLASGFSRVKALRRSKCGETEEPGHMHCSPKHPPPPNWSCPRWTSTSCMMGTFGQGFFL